MLRSINLALVLVTVGVSAAFGQRGPADQSLIPPKFELSAGYNNIHSNAPPGQTEYFNLNGGYVSGDFRITDWFSVGGEFTAGHANDISQLGQNLTLFTFLGGPRISRPGHRLVPFAEVLFGGAHGTDSYFPTATSSTTSASSWALSAGGGLDINLTRRFAIRAVNADYLRTALPNGTSDNSQNHLQIGAGVVLKFLPKERVLAASPVTHKPSEIVFTCGTNVETIDEGQALEIMGHTLTEPDKLEVTYTWTSDGGKIQGTGRSVSLNTTGMPTGEYRITGHAALVSNPTITAECAVPFHVSGHSNISDSASAAEQAAEAARKDKIFHENVQDALFDYDSADIRKDAHEAIKHAAKYLADNPSIRVLVEGYADERGSAEYNLALGEERANAARNALLAEGVSPDRIEIISYGKEAQVCTAENEACWQQNRRAAFSLHP
ncbi:OmpA family protein [Granulicella sp. S190]|uniref:OmpA family protein n=1 Tax=Granulicella sp. S190 TaxID=1747226 RepID=UPI00131C07D6|nr:OmpA family protein [Granulicella sp. S190]